VPGAIATQHSDGDWLATDQVPRRAVDEGLIDRYGLIDPGPRGNTSRYSLSGEVHRGGQRSLSSLNAYVVNYDFRLYSNFTYYLEHPIQGDQFEQVDNRWIYGLNASHRWQGHLGGTHTESAVGLQLRYDDIAYYYASRLPREPLDGIEDVHFHPMVKPSARVAMVFKF